MALHDDLLEQARHLANRERNRPRQASLRRAVSSAYYALFHLLIAEAVSRWKVAEQRPQLARIFEHARMNAASVRVFNAKTFPFTSATPTVDSHLRNVAATFSLLYENRQAADYELAYAWSRTDVIELIDLVADAFKSLRAIRSDPVTNAYLLSLFVKDRK